MSVRRPRVAVVDDDDDFSSLMRELLDEEGYAFVRPAFDDADPVDVLAAGRLDAVILDIRGIGGGGGLQLLGRIRSDHRLSALPVLVCSGDIQTLRDSAAELAGVEHVAALEKPFRIEALVGTLERLLADSVKVHAGAGPPSGAARAALERWLSGVGAALRWPVLDAWVLGQRPGMLRCAAAWAASPKLDAFAQVSRRTMLPIGGGVPGRIWISGRPTWIEDIASDMNFPRLPAARRTGLVSAAGVPVIDPDGRIAGVVAGYDQRLRSRDVAELERLRRSAEDVLPLLRGTAPSTA